MKTVTKLSGVNEVSIDLAKETLVVIGDVDPVCIATSLRKKQRVADIVSVGPYKKKEKEDAKPVCVPMMAPFRTLLSNIVMEVDAIGVEDKLPTSTISSPQIQQLILTLILAQWCLRSMVSSPISNLFDPPDLQSICYQFDVCAHQIYLLPYQPPLKGLANELYFNFYCITDDCFHSFFVQFHLQQVLKQACKVTV
ncbi:hypothetical protein L1887_24138 [Cichorium endivia]|nr:hypothetical protein L1887_24138 [Cichorium endivia]